ncbi:MAG: tRNA lysidine(34) synthetase TilS [Bacteroides sp.]|nr:tRNA lysidine(34) synthetase TilS [Bacteroides sp.]
MNAIKKRKNYIEISCRRQFNKLGISRVIATVSGGADSVAMLSAVRASGAEVIAAHCNFHLRGEESMRDEEHVREICSRLDVELKTIDFDVEAYISSHKGISEEMACRELRHNWFNHLLTELKADRIATGHNADDNIETLFLNLLRGSGTSGLRGMLPDTGKIWRPLLSFHRPEIIEYISEKNLSFVTDSTNLESDYRRNFLRNDIIPLLRSRWAGFDKALDRSISLLREENKVITASVTANLPTPDNPLPTATIANFPDPELLVRRYIEPVGPFTTTSSEVIAAIAANKPDIKTWKLRNGSLRLQNHLLYLIPK